MISVVILAYNSGGFVDQAIDSVLATATDVEVIVLENGSADNTWNILLGRYGRDARVHLVRHASGLGYAGGNNFAARLARGDILFFLNDDCIAEPGCLEILSEEFQRSSQLGILQCAVAVADGREWDTLGHSVDVWGFVWPMTALSQTREDGGGRYVLFGASGAALAIRRSLFSALGGFDEVMEFLCEETDLCWRALLLGYEVAGSARAVVRHRQLARYRTALRRSPLYFETRNRIRTLLVNMECHHAVEAVFVQCVGRLCLGVMEALRGRATPLVDVMLALLWNGRNLRGTLQRRGIVQGARRVSDSELLARGLLRRRPRLRDVGARVLRAGA